MPKAKHYSTDGSVRGDVDLPDSAFGIEPKPLGLFLDKWMVRYRKQGRFSVGTNQTAA